MKNGNDQQELGAVPVESAKHPTKRDGGVDLLEGTLGGECTVKGNQQDAADYGHRQ